MIEDGVVSTIADFWISLIKFVFLMLILWGCRPKKNACILSAKEIGQERVRKRSMVGGFDGGLTDKESGTLNNTALEGEASDPLFESSVQE